MELEIKDSQERRYAAVSLEMKALKQRKARLIGKLRDPDSHAAQVLPRN